MLHCMKTVVIIAVLQAVNLVILVRFSRELLVSNLALRQQLTFCKGMQRRPAPEHYSATRGPFFGRD